MRSAYFLPHNKRTCKALQRVSHRLCLENAILFLSHALWLAVALSSLDGGRDLLMGAPAAPPELVVAVALAAAFGAVKGASPGADNISW